MPVAVQRAPDVSLKVAGNKCFEHGEYLQALDMYREATKYEPNDPTYWSNMAACYERLGNYEKMAVAARNCITVDKKFVKGYYRLAIAQRELGELNHAKNTVNTGLAVQPTNKDLIRLRNELLRKDGVKGGPDRKPASYSMKNVSKTKVAPKAITPTRWQRENKSTPYHKKNVSTTRVIPPSSPIKKKKNTAGTNKVASPKPTSYARNFVNGTKTTKGKAQRRASYPPKTNIGTTSSSSNTPESLKLRGDTKYKNGQYKKAVTDYTKCLNMLPYNQRSIFVSKVLNNRAACYYQMGYYNDCINDCATILEKLKDTDNVRARIQRAQAFEHSKQYIKATKDAKYVLNSIPPSIAGHSNREECQRLISRCQRASIANLS